jgi:hypothetical protein
VHVIEPRAERPDPIERGLDRVVKIDFRRRHQGVDRCHQIDVAGKLEILLSARRVKRCGGRVLLKVVRDRTDWLQVGIPRCLVAIDQHHDAAALRGVVQVRFADAKVGCRDRRCAGGIAPGLLKCHVF